MGELFIFIKTDLTEVVLLFSDGSFLFLQATSFWIDWVSFYISESAVIKPLYPDSFEVCIKSCKPKLESIYTNFEAFELRPLNLVYDFSWFDNIQLYYCKPCYTIYAYFI